jgi:hypothetical protein
MLRRALSEDSVNRLDPACRVGWLNRQSDHLILNCIDDPVKRWCEQNQGYLVNAFNLFLG